jgi:hypothetical protein
MDPMYDVGPAGVGFVPIAYDPTAPAAAPIPFATPLTTDQLAFTTVLVIVLPCALSDPIEDGTVPPQLS